MRTVHVYNVHCINVCVCVCEISLIHGPHGLGERIPRQKHNGIGSKKSHKNPTRSHIDMYLVCTLNLIGILAIQ